MANPAFDRGAPPWSMEAPSPSGLRTGRKFSIGLMTNYDISHDGQRFVMVTPNVAEPGGLIWVQNFFEELKERVPN